MASANAALDAVVAEKGAGAVDIEAVDEGKPHIAMEVAIAELGEDTSSSSSSDSGGDEVGSESCGLEAGVGEVARSGRRRRPLIIDMGGDGCAKARDGDELDERDAASVDRAGAAAGSSDAGSATGGDVPSGQWITGTALQMRRKEIMRLIAAADESRAAAGPTVPHDDTCSGDDDTDGAAAKSSSEAKSEEH
jgi:hypothetical protein